MSLLRLLTAGKSLVGLKKSESRYHLPAASSLPRFGSKKNPFRATVFPEKGEPAAAEESPSGQPQPFGSSAEVAPSNARRGGEPSPGSSDRENGQEPPARIIPSDSKSEAVSKPPTSGPAATRPGFKAFLLWRRIKPRSLASFSSRPMVQGELSLDAVKVIRNDLSESDLEVVQSRKAEVSKDAKNSGTNALSKRAVSEAEYCVA